MKKHILITISCIIILQVHGQGTLSPNAYGYAQYAATPVNYYNGLPQISIPVATAKNTGWSVPISLSYHASGIKVEQQASWVGLGWHLNVGGSITVVSTGKTDTECSYFALNGQSIYNHTESGQQFWETETYKTKAQKTVFQNNKNQCNNDLYEKLLQGENMPDVYYYNFYGHSGQFVIDYSTNTPVLSNNNVDVKFEPFNDEYFGSTGWTATTMDGTIFTFDEIETRVAEGAASGQFESKTFYLTSVLFPKGHEVTFSYTSGLQVESIYTYTQSVSKNITDDIEFPVSASTSRSVYTPKYVSSINTPTTTITFFLSSRIDIFGEFKLSTIKLEDNFTGELKFFDFTYDYFTENSNGGTYLSGSQQSQYTSGELSKRLKLVSFGKRNMPAHEFTYNSTSLPDKTSRSRDYWGYYNGRNSSTLLPLVPELTNNSDLSDEVHHFTASQADRSSDGTYMQAGILTEIKYPLGKTVNFTYQPHTFDNYIYETGSDYEVYSAKDEDIDASEVTTTFTITGSEAISVHYDAMIYLGEIDPNEAGGSYVKIDGPGDDYVLEYGPLDNQISKQESGTVTLSPGTYTLRAKMCGLINIDDGKGAYAEIKVHFRYSASGSLLETTGGGLRIKNIQVKDKEGGDVISEKEFNYGTSTESYGKLMSRLMYVSQYTLAGKAYCTVTSNSNVALSEHAQGSHVGYDQVIVYNFSNGNMGKSTYVYHNIENKELDNIFKGNLRTVNIPVFADKLNGRLKREIHCNAEGVLKSQKYYYYSSANAKKVLGVIGITNYTNPDDEYLVYYPANSWKVYLIRSIGYVYDDNGQSSSRSVYYSYNDIGQLTEQREDDVKPGVDMVTTYVYPYDYNPTAVEDSMVADHCYSYLLSKTVTLGSETLSEKEIDYNYVTYNGQHIYYAENISATSGNNTTVTTNTVDANGNIIQTTNDKTALPTSFIWAYNNNHIVSVVSGATHSAATALISDISNSSDNSTIRTQINNIRNSSSLGAYVTTVTFDSFSRKESETDANGNIVYYKYDSEGRLFRVVDEYGNVLKEMHYHVVKQ